MGATGAPSPGRGRGFLRRHGRAVTPVVGVLAIAAAVIHFVVPRLSALGRTVHRLRGADTKWLGLGVVLEALSLGGYIALFRTVFSCHGARIGWKTSLRRLRRTAVAVGAGCAPGSSPAARRGR